MLKKAEMPLRSALLRFARPRSLRTYLVLFATALALPLLLLAAISLSRMGTLEQDHLELRIQIVANDLAQIVDRELDHAIGILETLATSRALASGNFSIVRDRAQQAVQNPAAAIFVLDQNFKQLVHTRAMSEQPPAPASDVATRERGIGSDSPQVSGVVTDPVSNRPVVKIQVPVRVNKEVRYILGMALDASFFAKVLQTHRPDPVWIAGITDQKGMIVARSERHDEFVGKALPKELFQQSMTEKGAFRGVSVAGQPIVRVTSRSQRAGWLVSATVPQWYADAGQRRWQSWLIVLTIVALTFGGALAYFFAGLIERPLAQSTRAATTLGKGFVVEPSSSPLIEANALTQALSNASKELGARAEYASVLTREVTHRSKNLLAVVIAMANQIARQSESVGEFQKRLVDRLHALARSKDLLVRGDWKGADMRELVLAQLEPFLDGHGSRLIVDGERVFLQAEAVRNIGMALHELATNASKYGALSTTEGRIVVSWRLAAEPDGKVFHLSWQERGGPPVRRSERRGFGQVVLSEIVPAALSGSGSLEFPPEGLHWSVIAPADRVVAFVN